MTIAKKMGLPIAVIPAQAGIECLQVVLDFSLRWSDVALGFLQIHLV